MSKKWIFSLPMILILVLSACALLPGTSSYLTPQALEGATPTSATLPTVSLPTEVLSATATAAPLPTQVAATPTTGPVVLPDISPAGNYLDDRSTPVSVLLSYYNAINRHEDLRAYSYWADPSTSQGTLDQFTNGYSDTASVSLVFGKVSSEGAAGSIYYTVPVVINSITTAPAIQKFAACYILRLSQPGNYGAPPINPMGIDRGTAKAVSLSTSDADAISSACAGSDFPVGPNVSDPRVESLTDLTNNNYIDNRSGAIEVISSLFNSFNSNLVVRAYSYWKNPSQYATFAANYADWVLVTATFGIAVVDAGAGQLYYQLPVAMKVQVTGGTLKTYLACYSLHLSNPGIQGTPPFEPLGIKTEKLTQVDNNSDTTPLLSAACQ
jgi:hypothetical protein